MAENYLASLPDELVDAIAANLPPADTVSFGLTDKRHCRITRESLLWRRHCLEGWQFWAPHHSFAEKTRAPPNRVKWRRLFFERRKTDENALAIFNDLLLTQHLRIQKIEQIIAFDYDIKDLFLSIERDTPEDADDALSRTYYARVILGRLHRQMAISTWRTLDKGGKLELEDVLGAYDLFALSGTYGDLTKMHTEFDHIAENLKEQHPNFTYLSTRSKAVRIAKYLRDGQRVGNPIEDNYHALRNNFMSMALFAKPHTSLPLQSVAIYCAVARRLGVKATPSNFPHHVIAVIEPPPGESLDGAARPLVPDDASERERMFMNPWFRSEEVDTSEFDEQLRHAGIPVNQRSYYLDPASPVDMVMRAGRNIMHSVQEARNVRFDVHSANDTPDIDSAWYGMLWATVLLENGSPVPAQIRRRQCVPYLFKHHQPYFPEDIGLFEKLIAPMFVGDEHAEHLLLSIVAARKSDGMIKAPITRTAENSHVHYHIGQHFRHRRYEYQGVIISWDPRCAAEERWITAMGVHDLPRGREQPFYHVLADDRSTRYVAEENIEIMTEQPNKSLLHLAGRYFNRWDAQSGTFISNIRDEYPDD